jgi:hypothetical protein
MPEFEAPPTEARAMWKKTLANLAHAPLPQRIVVSAAVAALLLLWAFPQVHFSYYRWVRGDLLGQGWESGEWQLLHEESDRLFIGSSEYGTAHVIPGLDSRLLRFPASYLRNMASAERRVGISWRVQCGQSFLIMALGALAFWTVHRKQNA